MIWSQAGEIQGLEGDKRTVWRFIGLYNSEAGMDFPEEANRNIGPRGGGVAV